MLDIAGGIIIAMMALGAFGFGVRLMFPVGESPAFVGLGVKLGGFCLAAAASAFIFWLLLIRTGQVSLFGSQ